MTRWIARLLFLITSCGVVLAPSAAGAGGWALASFDPLPPLEAGDDVQVGFTILQHGITPVEADSLGDHVGVTITGADGGSRFFAATPSGAAGHFVATIELPAEGAATINAEMGIFESSPPIGVDITTPPSESVWPTVLGIVLPVIAVVCLAVAVADVLASRRPRSATNRPASDIEVVVGDPSTT